MTGRFTVVSPLGSSVQGDELQIPNEARGDLLYRNATEWTRLPKGTNGQYLKIGANDPIWDTPSEWALLETITPSSVTSVTTGTLTAYSEYMVELIGLTFDTAASNTINMRINGDTGASDYFTHWRQGTTNQNTNAAEIYLARILNTVRLYGRVFITGQSGGTATSGTSGTIQCGAGTPTAQDCFNSYVWVADAINEQVATLTILMSAGNMTGTIRVYGRN